MAQVIAAGPFATEGERRAAELLQSLPPDWVVVCNKTLVTQDGRSYEIDFIVIGDRWVYLIDEKSWRGTITGNEEVWVVGRGRSSRSPLTKVDYMAKILAGHLRTRVPRLQGFFVHSGVLLSLSDAMPTIQDPRVSSQVFIPKNVLQTLTAWDRKDGTPAVKAEREALRKALIDLSPRPDVPTAIAPYTIEEEVSGYPQCKCYRATLGGREERLLMVYDLGRDPVAADQLQEFYRREFDTLRALRSTNLVPEVSDPFVWSDDFLVLPIHSAEGKPLATLPSPEGWESFLYELRLMASAFRGISQIHAANVVHRALGPDAIHVSGTTQQPRIMFTDFYAARLDANSIASSLDALTIEAPYAAPELAVGYGAATTASDVFSLGLLFVERLLRTSLANLRPADQREIALPPLATEWSMLPVPLAQRMDHLFVSLIAPDPSQRPAAASVADYLDGVLREIHVDSPEGRILDERYRVHRILGRGMTACSYLATDIQFGGLFAVKQFFWPSTVLEQAKSEFGALRNLSHRNLPRIYDVYPPQADIHVKLEYVPGPTLQEVGSEFPWPLERWWGFAQELMQAVEELERRQLLHRDIKPSNIILHEDDGRPVLIDFGFAVAEGTLADVAGAPLYLPPEALHAAQPPPSMDRYALAVVLFQALTGTLPFDSTVGGDGRRLRTPSTITEHSVRTIATTLLHALDPDPARRPGSILELRSGLQSAMLAGEQPPSLEELPDLINPWVDQLRGLYRNSEVGNADNRGLDSEFARETYVPTALDEHLLPAILEERPPLIFLSGNPGDGKTAFLEQLRFRLEARGAQVVHGDQSGWEVVWEGHTFRTCYDASEAHEGRSADEQLAQKLTGLEGDSEPTAPLSVLVAINDGRLADFFARYGDIYAWIAESLEWLGGARKEDGALWVVDLKKRAFVDFAAKSQSVFARILRRLVAPEAWTVCQGCASQAICPMYNNAQRLQEAVVATRLEHLLVLHHLRHQRHVTMRDLRSAIAYLITANTGCEAVHTARRGTDTGPTIINLAYWRAAFDPVDQGDELLSDLKALDPARLPQPRLDRFLHFHRLASDSEVRRPLFLDKDDLPPHRFTEEAKWIAAVKRRLYFEAAEPASVEEVRPVDGHSLWQRLLPYKHADLFLQLLAGKGDLEEARARLALGILRSDGVLGTSRPGTLSVTVANAPEQQLAILKQFPVEEFELTAIRPEGRFVEAIAEHLQLRHRQGTPALTLSLDLFELLLRMADGLQPSAPEFRPLLEDLVPFKSALLLRETRDLILVESQQHIHRVTQQGGKIVRLPHDEEER